LTKLLNNLLFTANLATAASTLALGRALNVDAEGLAEVVAHGSGSSFALGRIATHAGPLLRKDVGLVAALADAAGVPPGAVLRDPLPHGPPASHLNRTTGSFGACGFMWGARCGRTHDGRGGSCRRRCRPASG
jgi:hypothetical protein